MEESDASRRVSDNVSTLIDGAEASGSGYAAGRSRGCEDEAYNSHVPSSKHVKVMTSGRKRSKLTGKFRTSWKLPEHITASK